MAKAPRQGMTSWVFEGADALMEERDRLKVRALVAEAQLAALEAALPRFVEQACEAQRAICAEEPDYASILHAPCPDAAALVAALLAEVGAATEAEGKEQEP